MNWNHEIIIDIIRIGLKEDLGTGDVTTDSVVPEDHWSEAYITAKEEGVVAGLPLAQKIFEYIDPHLRFEAIRKDGDRVKFGDHLAKITGATRSILKGERLALNFLQRLSGIATKTAYYKSLVEDYSVRIVDTRKTTPGLRILEKYAVRVGGGHNHRMGLYDAVMIKDNHIEAAGDIRTAVELARKAIPHTMKIEVEVEDLEGVKEALEAGADIIMLDNMSLEMMKKAVEMINGRAIIEASGGITDENIKDVAATGVDVISMGALTHTVKSLDISLNINPEKIKDLTGRH
ncbi:nicotinate-nucleotide diphosphorylase (carboxylating) [Anoxybacter fermentans]|uniref:Probable nicotinate-nucleotide pyrophosphorylase [carboxylating] n=1 Tax=Anoxybacter fermentans TaxID=1323375 RepID=A0A3Q9HSJ0_9FIRM|nr:nicotinate-nucleotide diphosphorylase (carboxylating) [Anoxybacter fermentans]